jgi:hypothetical protein
MFTAPKAPFCPSSASALSELVHLDLCTASSALHGRSCWEPAETLLGARVPNPTADWICPPLSPEVPQTGSKRQLLCHHGAGRGGGGVGQDTWKAHFPLAPTLVSQLSMVGPPASGLSELATRQGPRHYVLGPSVVHMSVCDCCEEETSIPFGQVRT